MTAHVVWLIPPGRGVSTVMRLDWLASRAIVIWRLCVDLGGACPCGCERDAASATHSRLLTIPELYLASLEGLPEISNLAVSCLDQ